VVERQPSKLRVAGSNPVSRSRCVRKGVSGKDQPQGEDSLLSGVLLPTEENAHVAQSAEHILGKDEVTGSIPVMGSRLGLCYLIV
jgi:hypothetical protein